MRCDKVMAQAQGWVEPGYKHVHASLLAQLGEWRGMIQIEFSRDNWQDAVPSLLPLPHEQDCGCRTKRGCFKQNDGTPWQPDRGSAGEKAEGYSVN